MLDDVVEFGQSYGRQGTHMPAGVYSYLACNNMLYATRRTVAAKAYAALVQFRVWMGCMRRCGSSAI